jgi:hypothetical protein
MRGRRKVHREKASPEAYPILQPIYGGRWQAHGDGWAVDGDSKEEAVANYWKAVARHKEILALPPWHHNPDNPHHTKD